MTGDASQSPDMVPETPLKDLKTKASGGERIGRLGNVDLSNFRYGCSFAQGFKRDRDSATKSPAKRPAEKEMAPKSAKKQAIQLSSDSEEDVVVRRRKGATSKRPQLFSDDDDTPQKKKPPTPKKNFAPLTRKPIVVSSPEVQKVEEPQSDNSLDLSDKEPEEPKKKNAASGNGSYNDEDLARLMDFFPNKTTSELLAALSSHNSFDAASNYLLDVRDDDDYYASEKKPPAKAQSNGVKPTNGVTSRRPAEAKPRQVAEPPKKKRRAARIESDSDGDAGSDASRGSSDDESDGDPYASVDKEKVLGMFNECTRTQLARMPGCSDKRAESLIKLRPFKNFNEMARKLESTKGLTPQMIHGCQEMLDELRTIDGLLQRCEGISRKILKKCESIRGEDDRYATGTPKKNGVAKKTSSHVTQPATLKGTLKDHQIIGMNWLIALYDNNVNGILADEMGLGKTIQAIALLAYAHSIGDKGPHLIVVPSSTIKNWVRELNMWCPTLEVLAYYGSQVEREEMRDEMRENKGKYNVIVTTYHVCVNQVDRGFLKKLDLSVMIADEGHLLKNMGSKRYKDLMKFDAKHRLLLTGTPVQNNLLELMSLLNFAMPKMFGEKRDTLTAIFSGNRYDVKDESDEIADELNIVARAQRMMQPFVLRRLKAQVLQDMPEKTIVEEECPMTTNQKRQYEQLLKELKSEVLGDNGRKKLQNVMMQLRKMANHPLLHRHKYTPEVLKKMAPKLKQEPDYSENTVDRILQHLEEMSDFQLHQMCLTYNRLKSFKLEEALLWDSGKLDYLAENLPKMQEQGDRVLLFSQFTAVLDILEIFSEFHGFKYVRLDGATKTEERQDIIDQYNKEDSDVFIFLLSTRAGGVGINLTSANVVLLHDIDYNPHNDRQAEDRAHRVGQTRDVRVIKLVSANSIEIAMLKRAKEKLELEQRVASNNTGNSESGEIQDVEMILKETLGLA